MRSRSPSQHGRRGLAAIVHLVRVAAGIGFSAIWSILLWPELAAHDLLSWEWDQRFLLTVFGFLVIGLVAFWPLRRETDRANHPSTKKETSRAARPH
jgi:hypothetical protein